MRRIARLVGFDAQNTVCRSLSHGLAATDGFVVALGAAGFAAEDAFCAHPTEVHSVFLSNNPSTMFLVNDTW
jgi:hypothetical protein